MLDVDQSVVQIIDSLLAVEGTSLLERLTASANYVDVAEADDASRVMAMIDDEKQHARMLVGLLEELDAAPGPRRVDARWADLHYNRIETIFPRLIADKKRLVAEYERASAALASVPRAAQVAGVILARHREHLAKLERLAAKNKP